MCDDALQHLTATDLEFVGMSLNLQIELALSEAGLGHFTLACEQLDALLRRSEPLEGPLTMCALHEARAQVALLARDSTGFSHHFACLLHWTSRTSARALITGAERMRQAAQSTILSSSYQPANDGATERVHDLTVLHRVRHGGERSVAGDGSGKSAAVRSGKSAAPKKERDKP